MAAIFFEADGRVYTISNEWSVAQAGFIPGKEYYNKWGDTLRYYIRKDGIVLERISSRRRQTINHIYKDKEEANGAFIKLQRNPHVVNGRIDYSEKKTFETGKWVLKRK